MASFPWSQVIFINYNSLGQLVFFHNIKYITEAFTVMTYFW